MVKYSFCVLVTLAVIGISDVFAESCTRNIDCHITSCTPGTTEICQHPRNVDQVLNGGLCTCADAQCLHADDCFSDKAPLLTCHNAFRHCYDQRCLCDQFPGDHVIIGPVGKK